MSKDKNNTEDVRLNQDQLEEVNGGIDPTRVDPEIFLIGSGLPSEPDVEASKELKGKLAGVDSNPGNYIPAIERYAKKR